MIKVYGLDEKKEPLREFEIEMRRFILTNGTFTSMTQDFFGPKVLAVLRKWHRRSYWEFERDVTQGCITKKGREEFLDD